MKVSVIIPVYNERGTIAELLQRVLAVPVEKEVLVVDDFSQDGTRDLLPSLAVPPVRLLLHDRNRGKGAAVRTALAHVTGEIVILQDADLEYDPAEYPRLIEPIALGTADVVYGSRFLGRGPRASSRGHYLVNHLLTRLSNLFTGLRLSDMETCYKAFRADLLLSLPLESNGFDIEPELTARAARRKARFIEVPISYQGRSAREGKKIGWRDGVRALWAIARFGLWKRN